MCTKSESSTEIYTNKKLIKEKFSSFKQVEEQNIVNTSKSYLSNQCFTFKIFTPWALSKYNKCLFSLMEKLIYVIFWTATS